MVYNLPEAVRLSVCLSVCVLTRVLQVITATHSDPAWGFRLRHYPVKNYPPPHPVENFT